MSTIKVDNLQTTAGAGLYPAKAWVSFNGTGTIAINDDGGVSSLTDTNVGRYIVTFDSVFSSANNASVYTASAGGNVSDFTTGGNRQFFMVRSNLSGSVKVQAVDDGGGVGNDCNINNVVTTGN